MLADGKCHKETKHQNEVVERGAKEDRADGRSRWGIFGQKTINMLEQGDNHQPYEPPPEEVCERHAKVNPRSRIFVELSQEPAIASPIYPPYSGHAMQPPPIVARNYTILGSGKAI